MKCMVEELSAFLQQLRAFASTVVSVYYRSSSTDLGGVATATNNRPGSVPAVSSAMRAHDARLLALFDEALLSLTREGNVDTSPKPADRAKQMWTLLAMVASDLDSSDTSACQKNIKRFLLHVPWHEGAKLTRRLQTDDGPLVFSSPRCREQKTRTIMRSSKGGDTQTLKSIFGHLRG